MHKYPTNLTGKQWQVIKNMLDPKERFRKYSLRSVFDIDRDSAQCRDNIKRALTHNIDAATPHIFHDITPCGGNYDNTRLGDKTRCLVVCGNDTLRQFRADLKECDGPGGLV